MIGQHKRNFKLVPYQNDWNDHFKKEADLLISILGEKVLRIEHIGSTSIPGMSAKAIIDIMVGLENFVEADTLVASITHLGYVYIPEYEDVMPDRRYFEKMRDAQVSFHIHMVEKGREFWKRHLLFRDYLRENRDVADEYGLLKKKLAERDWKVTNDYAQAKTDFIRGVEEQARVSIDGGDSK